MAFADKMKSMATANALREFDLPCPTTIEEIFSKLNEHAAAFPTPFSGKGGLAGKRIVFEKEPDLDVTIWLYLQRGTHIRMQPNVTENHTSINGIRLDKNSMLRRGVRGAIVDLPLARSEYTDRVADTVRGILTAGLRGETPQP